MSKKAKGTKKMLKFSVAMCVYGGDRAEWLDEALESVYNQTRLPDEVVLTVDGPVGGEIEAVIEKYEKEHGAKVYRLPENMGHGVARRECFSHCSYEYVATADADDINTPDRFEKQMQRFEADPELCVVSSWATFFEGALSNVAFVQKMPETDAEIKEAMKTFCPICNASSIVKKSAVEEVGGYIDWYYAEDYYLWIRMMQNGAKLYNVQENLLFVRTSSEQTSRRGGYKYYKSLRDLYKLMYRERIISYPGYLKSVLPRFILQVLMPGKLRAYVRKKLF